MKAKIRKVAVFLEETLSEMGRTVDPPTRRAAAAAVIENPYAGRYVEDLSELMDIGEELGELLTQKAVAALGITANTAESYGKAAAVGVRTRSVLANSSAQRRRKAETRSSASM